MNHYLKHSWGNKPEQKRREKEYNRQYYLKRKRSRSYHFVPSLLDDTGHYNEGHGATNVPLSWASDYAQCVYNSMSFKDLLKDAIKTEAYKLEIKYPKYAKTIQKGFETVAWLLRDSR